MKLPVIALGAAALLVTSAAISTDTACALSCGRNDRVTAVLTLESVTVGGDALEDFSEYAGFRVSLEGSYSDQGVLLVAAPTNYWRRGNAGWVEQYR